MVEVLNNVVKMKMKDLKLKLLMMNQDHMLYMNEYLVNMDVVVVDDDDKIVMHKRVQIEQQQHIVHQQMNIIELLNY
jgi:hypothetical protein